MMIMYLLPLLSFSLSLLGSIEKQDVCSFPEFVIIVPSYNNEKYVEQNLASIFAQKEMYDHFSVIYINDCSTDKTGQIVEQYLQEHGSGVDITIIHNKQRKGATQNWYEVIHTLPKHAIVVCVDGDDALLGKDVLSTLAEIYSDTTVWMTYGNYVCVPKIAPSICAPFPTKVIEKNLFRNYRFISSHLRTFYAGLFQQIKKEDFIYKGQFLPVCCDVAMMIPMLEMSSHGHIKYISKIMYNYTASNPLSEFRIRENLIQKMHTYIAQKKSYQPLQALITKK